MSVPVTRLASATATTFAVTLFLVTVVTTNLTGLGLGTFQLTYDDTALPRLLVALIGTSIVWLAIAVMLHKGNALSWDLTWVTMGILAAWAVVSAAVSDSIVVWLGQSERLAGVITIGLYVAVFAAGLQVGRSRGYTRRLCSALVVGAAALALHGLLQVAKLDPTSYLVSLYSYYMGSAYASLGNPNFLAGVLVLALPVAGGLALTAPDQARRAFWWVSAVIMSVALYFTYSQGAWLAALVELSLAAALWRWSRRGLYEEDGETALPRRRVLRAAGSAVLIVVIGLAIIITASSIAYTRGLRLWGSSLSETSSGRLLLLQTTVNAVADRPLTGFGPDNYLEAFRLHRPDRYVKVFGQMSTNNDAHSWLLQYAATLGIPGMLLLGASLALALVRSRPSLERLESESAMALSAWIWLGALGYVVQMMFNVSTLASALAFWALLGAISSRRARRFRVRGAVGAALIVVCALGLAAAVVGSVRLVAADATFVLSRLAYNEQTGGDALALAENAARLNPLSLKYVRAVAQTRAALVYRSLERPDASPGEVRALYASARDAFDRTLQCAPNDYPARAWLAALQTAIGSRLNDEALLREAKATLMQAAALDRAHWELGPLLEGEMSDRAVALALGALALP